MDFSFDYGDSVIGNILFVLYCIAIGTAVTVALV